MKVCSSNLHENQIKVKHNQKYAEKPISISLVLAKQGMTLIGHGKSD